MANGDVFAHETSESRDRCDRSNVLDVGAHADLDPLIVAAQHRAEPTEAPFSSAPCRSRQRCRQCRSFRPGVDRVLPVELVDRHESLPLAGDISTPIKAFSSESGDRFASRKRVKQRVKASTPAARRVIRKNVPDIRLQKPAMMVAIMTNSKRRRSTFTPASVLRMMMKGAANNQERHGQQRPAARRLH